MEGAAQAATFEPSEGEIGAAMCAVALDQAVAALLVAEQHQVFAEHFHRPHRARALQLVDQRRRLPVTPHQLAARILGARAGDQVVRFLAHHGGGRLRNCSPIERMGELCHVWNCGQAPFFERRTDK